jgi:hypothetical protein
MDPAGGQDGLRAAVTVTVARVWEAAAAGEFVEGPSALVPQPRDRHARRSAVRSGARSGSGSGGKIVTPSSDGAGGRCGCRRCASWESRMGSSLSPPIRAWGCLRHEPHRRRALHAAERRPPEVRLQQAGSRVQRAAVRAGRAAACAKKCPPVSPPRRPASPPPPPDGLLRGMHLCGHNSLMPQSSLRDQDVVCEPACATDRSGPGHLHIGRGRQYRHGGARTSV